MKTFTLNPQILVAAYSQGFFPMPEEQTEEVRWYRPDPRAIIPLQGFHISRSLQRRLNRKDFSFTFNQEFREVMKACSHREETWINDEFLHAYGRLHELNKAHSVEIWRNNRLIGGLYGVSLGGAFFAESMFHREPDASKIALHALVQHLIERRFTLLECQFLTAHLKRLGAIEISDQEYMKRLKLALAQDVEFHS
ncbi:MAG: leucyl/phenylalanyl-tRNA--protein transferase [Deltaproteobacteria bacterium]|nr:leucyl/phenylalanyl-tRNA--protein transferase [Deltaproteobacteria bacterium]